MIESILRIFSALAGSFRSSLKHRSELAFENLALRQQVLVLNQKRPRPKLGPADRALWALLRACWTNWRVPLEIVQPDTVVRWHRYGFRLLWRWKSLRGSGPRRPRVERQVRDLIRQMANENGWGAPRIHGELLKLGFDVSERSVSRYVTRRPGTPEQIERWKAFLRNHREAIAAMDLFVVPTATFRLLYGLVIIHHDRRQVLHFNATEHPTEDWVVQQLRDAFPYDPVARIPGTIYRALLVCDLTPFFSPKRLLV
jgi:putative transposase